MIFRRYLILTYVSLFSACNAFADALSLENVELGMSADQALKNYSHCGTESNYDELRLLSCDNKFDDYESVNKEVHIDQSIDKVVFVKAEYYFESFVEAKQKYDEFLHLYGEGVFQEKAESKKYKNSSMCYGECSGGGTLMQGSNLVVNINSYGWYAAVYVYLADHRAVSDLYKRVFHASNIAEESLEGAGNSYDLSEYKVADISLGMHWDESARATALRLDRNYYFIKILMWRKRYIEKNKITGEKQSRAIRIKSFDRTERLAIYFEDNIPPHSESETQVVTYILYSTTKENMEVLLNEALVNIGEPTWTTPRIFIWCEVADADSSNGCGSGAQLEFSRKTSRVKFTTDRYGKILEGYLAKDASKRP